MRRCFVPSALVLAFLILAGVESARAETPIGFEQVELPDTRGAQFTSLAVGPDRKLYATEIDGSIRRWPLAADGTLGDVEILDALRSAEGGDRLLIGFRFDPSAQSDQLVAWVSHTTFGFSNMPDWAGKVTRLSGPNLEQVQDYVIGLPRSARDHVTNSIDFGPDGALYLLQGSNSAMGAPDNAWALRPERTLSAAVLRFEPDRVVEAPLDVQTSDGGSYDPYAQDAPLTIYASGTRNAYDLVWHTNGELYVPTNGSAAGGNTPTSSLGAPCTDGSSYSGPIVPGLTGVGTQPDYLYRVQRGAYYGHPNPARCQFAMNGANPTTGPDPGEVGQYPVGTVPDANYAGFAFDFGAHRSPNGIIEYRSGHFGGTLRGLLLVARYRSGDIIILEPGATNGDISGSKIGFSGLGGFERPLDVTEDTCNGFLYVSEFFGARITLLRPLEAEQPVGCATPTPVTSVPIGSLAQALLAIALGLGAFGAGARGGRLSRTTI